MQGEEHDQHKARGRGRTDDGSHGVLAMLTEAVAPQSNVNRRRTRVNEGNGSESSVALKGWRCANLWRCGGL
jgi:hypothetical protein